MYAASTVPDTVAKPDDIIAWISDAVRYYKTRSTGQLEWTKADSTPPQATKRTLTYGRISSGDSVIPKKILPAAVMLSHTVVPSTACKIQPNFFTVHCMAPQ